MCWPALRWLCMPAVCACAAALLAGCVSMMAVRMFLHTGKQLNPTIPACSKQVVDLAETFGRRRLTFTVSESFAARIFTAVSP